jgi:hypothetical protein
MGSRFRGNDNAADRHQFMYMPPFTCSSVPVM